MVVVSVSGMRGASKGPKVSHKSSQDLICLIHLVIKGHPTLRYGCLEHLLQLAKLQSSVFVDVVHPEEELDGRVRILAGKLRERLDVLVHDDAPVFLPVENCERAVDEKLLKYRWAN